MHGEESGPQISGYWGSDGRSETVSGDPDGDFVQMVDLDEQAKTVIMTKGTTSKGQRVPQSESEQG